MVARSLGFLVEDAGQDSRSVGGGDGGGGDVVGSHLVVGADEVGRLLVPQLQLLLHLLQRGVRCLVPPRAVEGDLVSADTREDLLGLH